MFMFNLALKSSKLSFFAPIIEGSDEYDDDDRAQDRDAFYPPRLRLRLVRAAYTAPSLTLEKSEAIIVPHQRI